MPVVSISTRVELVAALAQLGQDADEVAAHAAADAAVVQLEDFLVRLDDELVVDADLAEFVFDHGDALAVIFGEDAVEQRGLAGAEKAGDDGDGNEGGVWTWRYENSGWKILSVERNRSRRGCEDTTRLVRLDVFDRGYLSQPRPA